MNRKIVIGIIAVLVISILYVVFKKIEETTKEFETQKNAVEKVDSKKIPLFEFKNLDGTLFSKYDLPEEKSIIIVYFDPQCGLCEKSGKIFNRFHKVHHNSKVLFVTSNTRETALNYADRFGLDTIPNIRFFQSDSDRFFELFKTSKTPSYIVYNKRKELTKVIDDDVPVKTLLRYIKAAQVNAKE